MYIVNTLFLMPFSTFPQASNEMEQQRRGQDSLCVSTSPATVDKAKHVSKFIE